MGRSPTHVLGDRKQGGTSTRYSEKLSALLLHIVFAENILAGRRPYAIRSEHKSCIIKDTRRAAYLLNSRSTSRARA
jgi:hypothetical protein